MIYVFVVLAVACLWIDLVVRIWEHNKETKELNNFRHQGSWESNPAEGFISYHCNVCMAEALFDSSGFQITSRHCPNCGSWMCDDEGNVLVDP